MKTLILSTLLFLAGCATNSPRTPSATQCTVGDFKSCQNGLICEQLLQKETRCSAIPETAPVQNLIIPFEQNTSVVCTHSSGIGSHAWKNALFALDLAADYSENAPKIIAAQGGKVFVFQSENGKPCPTPEGTSQNSKPDKCGDGWGNHVKILHDNGYYSFYTHLEQVLVKTGQQVKQGDVIGIMGSTGLAGHRHLHWSVQKLPGNNQAEWEENVSMYDGQSVPFLFKAQTNNGPKVLNAAKIDCPHANIGQIPGLKQPHFYGL